MVFIDLSHRAVFNRLSKLIRNCFGFTLQRSVIGLKNSRPLLNHSDAEPKPISTWSCSFSRAWRRLRVFALSSHWLILLFTFVVIRHYRSHNIIGFSFRTLNGKLL